MRQWVSLVGFVLLAFVAGFVGSRFLPGDWYAGLAKPSFNPPNSVFGPVWSVLYLLMGIAAWRAWRQRGIDAVHAVGESGDSAANALVNATDVIGTRNNTHGPLNPAAIDDRFDFNRDRLVNATDLVIARDHATSPLSALRLITPNGALPSAPPLRQRQKR